MTRPLRVLQVANQPGPLALFEMPVCQAMRDAGADVELACMRVGALAERLDASGFPLHWIRYGSWKCPATWWRCYRELRALMKRGRYDLLIAHTPVMSWIARFAARGIIPVSIYMAHGLSFAPVQPPLARAFFRRIERAMARYTDAVLVMNQADADACARYRLTRTGKYCFRIPGVGVDVQALQTPPTSDALATLDRELNLSPARPMLLYLGRFIPAKRPMDILTLARRVGDKADFVLAGEGPIWQQIRDEANRIGPHVHVLGWTDHIHTLLHRCTLAMFPSTFIEGLPRFLLEAQVCGKPAVAYRVRGSEDVILDAQTGLLAPPADVGGFCGACEKLLLDPALCQRLGQAGRQRVERGFSLNTSLAARMSAMAETLRTRGFEPPWK